MYRDYNNFQGPLINQFFIGSKQVDAFFLERAFCGSTHDTPVSCTLCNHRLWMHLWKLFDFSGPIVTDPNGPTIRPSPKKNDGPTQTVNGSHTQRHIKQTSVSSRSCDWEMASRLWVFFPSEMNMSNEQNAVVWGLGDDKLWSNEIATSRTDRWDPPKWWWFFVKEMGPR